MSTRIASVLLFVLPLLASVWLYPRVLADVGLLDLYDDGEMLEYADTYGLTLGYLLRPHGYHIVPLIRLTFWVWLHTIGPDWWLPYAILLLAAHTGLCAAVGWTLWRFTDSLVLGLGFAVLLALSRNLAMGVLWGPIYVTIYALLAAILLVAFPALQHARCPRLHSLVAVVAVVAWALLTLSSGVLALVASLLWYGAGRIVAAGHCVRVTRPDVVYVGTLALVGSLLLGVHLLGAAAIGYQLPTAMFPCDVAEATSLSMPDRVLYTIAAGSLGLVWVQGVNTFPVHMGEWRYLPASLLVLGSAFSAWRVVRCPSSSFRYAAFLVSAALTVLASAMIVAGRGCPALDHMRHVAYPTLFSVLCAGFALSWLLEAVPCRVRPVLLLAVVALTGWAVANNLELIFRWNWYLDR